MHLSCTCPTRLWIRIEPMTWSKLKRNAKSLSQSQRLISIRSASRDWRKKAYGVDRLASFIFLRGAHTHIHTTRDPRVAVLTSRRSIWFSTSKDEQEPDVFPLSLSLVISRRKALFSSFPLSCNMAAYFFSFASFLVDSTKFSQNETVGERRRGYD